MSEFKRIYLYEYSHRLLGRVIGLAFLRALRSLSSTPSMRLALSQRVSLAS